MDTIAHLRHHRAAGEALVDAARRAGVAASVPTCPGWTIGELVGHVGAVQHWVLAHLDVAPDERVRFSEVPTPPPGEEVLDWFAAAHERLAERMAGLDPEVEVGSFVGPVPLAWWARRQAMELAVHRYDAEVATGRPSPVDAALGVDGVDELFDVIVPRLGAKLAGNGETIHLHATDVEGEWLLERTAAGAEVRRGHAKGDVAVRGPAGDLFLLVWGRRDLDVFEVFGDAGVFERWQDVTAI